MTIKNRGDQPRAAQASHDRVPGGNRCPVRWCTGVLRGELDGIGRVTYHCDDCERRAQLEHEARFGTYLDHLRALRRVREAKLLEEAEGSGEARYCEICGGRLAPPHTRVCAKVECKRAWKAEYQRQRFGRPVKAPEAKPLAATLELFKDFP